MAQFLKNYEYIISRHIDKHKPEVIFIDNLTAISGGMLADSVVATKIMDTLLMLKHRYKLTVVIIAHCPKSNNSTLPITSSNMSGSSVIMAYADSITAIGMSAMDKSIRYMKQTKTRTGEMIFDEDNVIQLAINKEGAFLQLKTLEDPFGREKEHLTDFNQIDETEVIEECIQYMHINNKSLRDTIKDKKLQFTHTTLSNKIKKYKLGSVQNEFNHSEPVQMNVENIIILSSELQEPLPF